MMILHILQAKKRNVRKECQTILSLNHSKIGSDRLRIVQSELYPKSMLRMKRVKEEKKSSGKSLK